MPLASIVVIVVRLFALNWLLTSVPLLLSAAAAYRPSDEHQLFGFVILYAPGVLLLVFAAAFWILAPTVAGSVTRSVNTNLNIDGLSRSDLYSFAFVFLGLYFILSSFADVINWIHYFATLSHYNLTSNPRHEDLYGLTRPFLTLIAGLVSLLGAPRWTTKLLSRDQKGSGALTKR